MRQLCLGVVVLLSVLAGVTAPGAAAAPAPTHWCGADEATADRVDAVASYQVHVVYAIPSDGADQFAQRALPIAQDLAAVDSWWRLQDSGRVPRFDLAAFPGCDSTFGALDISVARLAQPGSAYSAFELGSRNAFLYANLAPAIGNVDSNKKYLVYYDGPVDPGLHLCGFSTRGPNTSGGSISLVLLNAPPAEGRSCGNLGASDFLAKTAAHELLHNLGAVPDEAPNMCNAGHVCDDRDIMFSGGPATSLFNYALDVGHDDYYGHSGDWWDVQDSPFLAHVDAPLYPLTVKIDGAGGRVDSDLPGISCPPACSISWENGSEVELSASGEDGAPFAGWSGDCSGDICVLTMDGPKTVTARFAEPAKLHVAVTSRGGAGRVTGPQGLDCQDSCDFEFDAGTKLVLRAVPDRGSRLVSWSVASCGAGATCPVTLDTAKTVRATFAPVPVRLTARVGGRGRITSIPAGIACPRTCTRTFPYGKTLRLTARAAAGWKFAAWSGACRGARACNVKLTKTSLVRAQFKRS